MPVRFNIRTFGCKVNQYEADQIKDVLIENHFLLCEDVRKTNVFIVNSCTVTGKVDRDIKRFIRKLLKENPKIKIMVAGCFAETEQDRKDLMSIDGVQWLVRNSEKKNIVNILLPDLKLKKKELGKIVSRANMNRDRVFIKIQDGCNNACSYCKTTIVRGRSVSKPLKDVKDEVNCFLEQGFKEIVFTGICLGDWGKDLPLGDNISTLLKEIVGINGDFRVRLSSIEPLLITDELLGVMASSPKICRHLHIPFQNGDNGILQKMNRKYTSEQIEKLVKKIRSRVPGIGITTDIIVGFPGEDEKAFENTYQTIKKIAPIRIHLFAFSKRKGTQAFDFKGDIRGDVIRKRQKRLQMLVDEFCRDFAKEAETQKQYVLVESQKDKKKHCFAGYTDTYLRVFIENAKREDIGNIRPFYVEKVGLSGVFGKITR